MNWDAIDTVYSNEYYARLHFNQTIDPNWQAAQRAERRTTMRRLFGEIQPSWDYEEYDLAIIPSLYKKGECPSFEEICQLSAQECYNLMMECYRRYDSRVDAWDEHRTAIPGKVVVEKQQAFQNPDPTATTMVLIWLIDRGKPLEKHFYRA